MTLKANYQVYCSIARPIHRSEDPTPKILKVVGEKTNVPISEITRVGKKGKVIFAKHIYRYMLYNYTLKTLEKVAWETGVTDHSTTINSLKVCGDLYDTDPAFRRLFDSIEKNVQIFSKKQFKK